MKNILVGVDFNEETDILLDKAFEFASLFDAQVWLVHVAAPEPDFIGYDVGPQYIRDTRAEELRDEHRKLQQYADQMQMKGVSAEGLLISGVTTDMLLAEAEKLKADLIIFGHHQHSALYNLFFESVTADVMKKAKVPMLVVPFN